MSDRVRILIATLLAVGSVLLAACSETGPTEPESTTPSLTDSTGLIGAIQEGNAATRCRVDANGNIRWCEHDGILVPVESCRGTSPYWTVLEDGTCGCTNSSTAYDCYLEPTNPGWSFPISTYDDANGGGGSGGPAPGDGDPVDILDKIYITCNSPARSLGLTCNIQTEPANLPVYVLEWTFVPAGLEGNPIEVQHHSTTWQGPAVASGRVSARVDYSGVEFLPQGGDVTVRPRSTYEWQDTDHSHQVDGADLCSDKNQPFLLEQEPITVAYTVSSAGCSARWVQPRWSQNEGFSITQATYGPNTGLWYVHDKPTWIITTASRYNDELRPGHTAVHPVNDPGLLSDCRSYFGGSGPMSVNWYQMTFLCQAAESYSYFMGQLDAHEKAHHDAVVENTWSHSETTDMIVAASRSWSTSAVNLENEIKSKAEAVYTNIRPHNHPSGYYNKTLPIWSINGFWSSRSFIF